MGGQETGFIQLHSQVQPGLSSQGGKNAVRLFFFDELFQHFNGEGLNVYSVGDVPVCHDGSRVGIHQDYLHALFLQGTAGLCACIIKLGSLSDNDRTGTDDHYFFNIRILRHAHFLHSSS